jgi:asparagine synthase (glutamine-hydrolysing)
VSSLVGWVDFQRDLSRQQNTVRSMAETMRKRGPDVGGTWVSLHAALGFRGFSTGEAIDDNPPMRVDTGDGTVAVALVGHIYNAPELRREIEAAGGLFRTGSDAEVLLWAFLTWDDHCIDRLDGMFGFSVWDGRRRRLLLGRDRLGMKPLYYYDYPGGLLFASEPKGILANPLFTPRLDVRALPIVLQPRLALPGETPLVGLHEVPPAHALIFSEQGLSQRRYWQLASVPHLDSWEQTTARVRELMTNIVRRQVPTSVPCGAMLSGGVDSTSVASLAARLLRKRSSDQTLATFCVQFASDRAHFVPTELRPDVDAPYAAAAAGILGTSHTTLTLTTEDLAAAVPATRQARDLPGWGQFDASMFLLFQEMRRHCAVALTGEAADEIFGGYPYFFDSELINRDHFPWLGDGPRLSDFLTPELRAEINPREDERARYSQLRSAVPRLPGEDPENARMREIFYFGLAGPLAVILDRKERMSMAHGLEIRVPFCDHRLIEYVWNVPWRMKSAGGVKGLLKAALADVIPPGTMSRKKSAYPHVQSPQYDEALLTEATRIVNYREGSVAAMFDRPRLAALIERIRANELRSRLPGGASAAQLMLPIVELQTWIDDYRVSLA